MLVGMNLKFVKLGATTASPAVGRVVPPTQFIGAELLLALVPGATYFSKIATFVADSPGVALMTAKLAAVGEHTAPAPPAWPNGSYSTFTKKNNLFFRTGPPIWPPNRLLSNPGFEVNPRMAFRLAKG